MEKITYSIEKLAPGLCFTMGKDGTWWQVLEVNTKKKTVLVIADECICNRSYNEEWEDITWEECTLRQWLNGEYFEKTFSDKEKEAIIECKIKTPKNAKYKTKGGADTKDKIWLLSIDELNKYFKVIKNSNTGSWWLRSPGSDQKCASYAFSDVVIRNEGNCVYIEWGVRPAFLLNLNSSFFKQMFEDEDSLKIKVPELYIQDCILERVRPGIKNVQIPEGVTEIHENCFAYMNKLKEVKFPTTLKKIGNEAFVGCASLESVAGTNGSITYGKCVFSSCKKLNYTAEMFHNTGKLSDSFKSHMENCGPAELAWIIMYQKSIDWEDALSKKITKDNANKILEVMKEHIAAAKKLPKKEATAATSFVTANILLFSSDEVRSFCDMLTDKKLAGLAESIQSDPSVMNVLGTSDSRAAESGLSGKLSGSVSQIVMPDGSILYGEMESCIEPGCRFPMGNAGTKWRILSIDQEEKTAVVIADKPICNRSYNEKVEDITWEQCTLRQWLNGKYFEETFSDQEKEAIIECEIKTPDNIKYGTEGGADTKDRIWLLSIDEAIQYFADDEDRITRAFWWLRSPGWYQDYAAGVYVDGSVYVIGSYFSNEDGVRPAFLLNLNSSFFKSIISTNQDGKDVIRNPELVIKNGVLLTADSGVTDVKLPAFVKAIQKNAFENCKNLKSLSWEASCLRIDPEAFRLNSNVKLPAEFYLGNKLPHENFARFVPEDPAVIANLLILADKKSAYRHKAIEAITIENAQGIAEKIFSIMASMKKIKSTDNILRFLLASYQVISYETIGKLCDLLEADAANAAGIKAVQEAVKQKKGGPSVIAKGIFDLAAESKDINVTALLLQY